MAERLAKKNVVVAKRTKEAGEAFRVDPQITEEPKAKRPKTATIPVNIPEKRIPEKRAPQLKLKGPASTIPTADPKGKGTTVFGAGLSVFDMTTKEVQHHLAVQGSAIFGGKSTEEMTEFLNATFE
ncbi:putative titin isoform X19 [Sesbania bispinosa]|nr:putative titin isoform X19 [Sesbania bispinosa]